MAERSTKQCPLCFAEIPAAARKCQHCGEWVDRPAVRDPVSPSDESLGRAADKYVNYQIVMSVIGLILAAIVFVFFFLPGWNQVQRGPLISPPTLRP